MSDVSHEQIRNHTITKLTKLFEIALCNTQVPKHKQLHDISPPIYKQTNLYRCQDILCFCSSSLCSLRKEPFILSNKGMQDCRCRTHFACPLPLKKVPSNLFPQVICIIRPNWIPLQMSQSEWLSKQFSSILEVPA